MTLSARSDHVCNLARHARPPDIPSGGLSAYVNAPCVSSRGSLHEVGLVSQVAIPVVAVLVLHSVHRGLGRICASLGSL